MTIKEALIAELEPITISDAKMNKALQAQQLDGETTYIAADHERGVDLAYAGLLLTKVMVSEVREDDVSIKFTTTYGPIVSWLYKKWGLPDPFAIAKPTVTQKLFW